MLGPGLVGVWRVLPGILAGDEGSPFAVPSFHGPGKGLREPVEQEWVCGKAYSLAGG